MSNKSRSFASCIACEDIASPAFLADGSIVDSRQPEDLVIVLEQHFGKNFERCLVDQKLLLIELVSFSLRSGEGFSEVVDMWNVDGLLPIPVVGSEIVDRRSAVHILQLLTASLVD